MVFGSALRLLRVDAGASLRELAAAVGVSSAYLSRVENGHDPAPTPDRLTAIAVALGQPPALLVELADRVEPAVAGYMSNVPAANRLFLEIARRELTAAQVGRVLAFVEAEFPDAAARGQAGPTLHSLLSPDRVILGLRCAAMDDLLDLAASRLAGAWPGTSAPALAAALRSREAVAPCALGGAFALPHTAHPGGPPAAALFTLANPLPPGPDGVPVRVVLVLAGLGDRSLTLLPRAALLARGRVALDLAAATHAEGAIQALRAAERWSGGA
jgi:PTS system nitrogen regulatory IIA component